MKFGLIGRTLGHSCSPEIHQKIFQALYQDGNSYELLEMEPEELGSRLKQLAEEGYAGVNVTIPYKRDVMPFLKGVSAEAESIGAVNTIKFTEDGMYGFNTDYTGFGRSLLGMGADPHGRVCVVLGTGGAARAVVQFLADYHPEELLAVSRHKDEQGEFREFLEKNGGRLISYEELADKAGDILVNCTPVGMYPKTGKAAVSEDVIKKFRAAMDLIYNPKETEFLRMGRVNGLKTRNGMYMLTAQAVAAEEIWQNRQIPEEILQKIAEEMEA
ncbi:MAG: shikimate dehydrogenase family protein [Eubacterium sp.]